MARTCSCLKQRAGLAFDQETVNPDVPAVMNATDRRKVQSVARRFADRRQTTYAKAVACLRDDLNELLTCFRYKTLDEC